jgi:predicted small lipoprotein YifL
MKKIFVSMALLLALLLTACGAKVTLDSALTSALNTYADQYDAQHPGDADWNIARLCVNDPLGLYRHEGSQLWAVVCKIPAMPGTYGAVLLDSSYTVLLTEHLNAANLTALEELVFSVGWEAR